VAAVGTVTNTLTDPSGRPLRDVTVRVKLISPLNPFILNGTGEILSQVAVDTDETGTWSVSLTPNSELENVNAYYLVDESCAPGGLRWPIAVPDGAGPFELRDILVSVPPDADPDGPVQVKGIWYHHEQITPSREWIIPHNLGWRPSIRVKDSAGSDWIGFNITDDQPNTMTIDVGFAFAGTAELS
jgi:hypothetical protein